MEGEERGGGGRGEERGGQGMGGKGRGTGDERGRKRREMEWVNELGKGPERREQGGSGRPATGTLAATGKHGKLKEMS